VRWGAPGLAASFAIAYILNTLILVPLYYSRKLVPKGTLFSLESAIIWLILVVLVFLNIADVPLRFRAIAFVPCLVLAGIAFSRLMRDSYLRGGLEHES
jgi:glucan phosphoethanolaminetransferase (alkaline phosphatase superfamily)